MFFLLVVLFSCQMFYYSDNETKEIEVSKVSSEYNIGISKAVATSVKVFSFQDGHSQGHGSGNLLHIGNHLFILTASHVIDDSSDIVIREKNGNMLTADVVYQNQYTDIAILLPYGTFTDTKSASYVVNKEHDILAKKLYYYGYPQNIDGFLVTGFVSQSSYDKILMQSYAWFGSSGSVVYDSAGRVVGIVHAIAMQLNPATGYATTSENIVVVHRTYDLGRKKIRERLVDAKAKNRHPN